MARMAKLDLRNRAPSVEYLPDGRQRLERHYDLLNFTIFTQEQIIADVWIPWGSPDETYPLLRLIKQDVTGQHPTGEGQRGDPDNSPERHPPHLTRVYEQIDEFLETPVGKADVTVSEDGITSVVQESIQFSAGTAVYGVPGTTLGLPPWDNLVLRSETRTDDGDLMRIKRVFTDKGLISQSDEFRHFGKLLLRTLTYVNMIPPTPAGFTLIDQDVKNPNGLPIYTYKFAAGLGLVDERYVQRDGGLRVATWISLGTAYDALVMQPPGIVLAKDQKWVDGMYEYMVSTMQNPSGGDLTLGTAFSYITKSPFRYPGRAKAYRKDFTAYIDQYTFIASAYDIFKSPPIEVDLDATVVFSYSLAPSLDPADAPYWNPDNWATYEAIWQGYNVSPHSQVEPLTGYRAINPGVQLDFTAGSAFTGGGSINVSGVNTSCLGNFVYGLSHGHITVFGGPPDPENLYWTTHYKIEPAFTDIMGVQYFRKLQIISLVPPQSALPV